MLVGTSVGEPVRWQDGSLTEATAWKFIPSVVELTTQDGVERVDPKKLHPDWLKFKFPHEDQIFAISRLEMLESILNQLQKTDPPLPHVDPKEIQSALEALQKRIQALEGENAKLKAALEKNGNTQLK